MSQLQVIGAPQKSKKTEKAKKVVQENTLKPEKEQRELQKTEKPCVETSPSKTVD